MKLRLFQCIFQAAQVCSNCGVNMGEYFCNICKFYDDDVKCFDFTLVLISSFFLSNPD